jgi:hypothetical protein
MAGTSSESNMELQFTDSARCMEYFKWLLNNLKSTFWPSMRKGEWNSCKSWRSASRKPPCRREERASFSGPACEVRAVLNASTQPVERWWRLAPGGRAGQRGQPLRFLAQRAFLTHQLALNHAEAIDGDYRAKLQLVVAGSRDDLLVEKITHELAKWNLGKLFRKRKLSKQERFSEKVHVSCALGSGGRRRRRQVLGG